ncbi:MAG: sugar transferase [Kordiimonadaceae bacterium]|mgnify:FL=1|jgi:lipopolysaccharide/colanic/teichoic acid biosynthesis glycosyltransferase|nr:sugar transferase [Kordiimonadaceae bacterium]
MQRFFDIIFCSVALIVLSPFLIPISILLKLTGEGEIFFVQSRVGKQGNIFGLLKFATMLKDSPNMSMGTVTVKDDPRVLPMGKFLRKTKINELPQLLNVLLGEMSLIGPRPQTQRCFYAFPKVSQDVIIKVRPGLSGLGSIVFRAEEEILEDLNIDRLKYYDEIIAPYKGKLEQWYVENNSISNYFKLIFATVWVVLFSKSTIYKSILNNLPSPPPELNLN